MTAEAKKTPAPVNPKIPEITSVEPLLPIARQIVKRHGPFTLGGLGLKPGQMVLMIVDSTNDRLVQDAFEIAIREAGGKLEKIMLYGYPGMTDPVELVETMFSRNWWPKWAWLAAKEADAVMQGALLVTVHTPNLPVDISKKPKFVNMKWTADLLASNYETFPVEVRDAIDKSVWENYAFAKNIELSDLEGTNMKLALEKEDWDKDTGRMLARYGLPYMPGHLGVPISLKKCEGILATSSLTFGGLVPITTMIVKGGRVVEVSGGGKFGETLRRSIEEYKDLTSPHNPGPGVNWLSSLTIWTHPKARRSAFLDRLTGSARVHGYAFGHRRSGFVHTAIGEGTVGNDRNVIWHIDQFFSTLTADGKKVIDRGHLLALDDPRVHKMAEKYGDPEKLLAEEWVPVSPSP